METKTIKLINHNRQAEFFIQVKGADTEQLIAEGKTIQAWGNLYNDVRRCAPTALKVGFKLIPFLLEYIKEEYTDEEYLKWATNLLEDGEILQGITLNDVEEIVT